MKSLVAFVLNLPWTILGLLSAILSLPTQVTFSKHPFAIILTVRSLWWYRWLPGKLGTRAITNGHAIQLSPSILEQDLEHELVHVEQHQRLPGVFPALYLWQSWRHGYRQNKYEVEAYDRSGSKYLSCKNKAS